MNVLVDYSVYYYYNVVNGSVLMVLLLNLVDMAAREAYYVASIS